MTTVNIMLDLETLGTSAGSVVLSVGAVSDAPNSEPFYCVFNIDQSLAKGLRVSGETLAWWADQSPEARKVLTQAAQSVHSNFGRLCDLKSWIEGHEISALEPAPEVLLWAKPAMFDFPILRAAFEAYSLPSPWDWRAERDMRTLIKLLPHVEQPLFEGEPHNALDDAKHQLRYLHLLLDEQQRLLHQDRPYERARREGSSV